MDPQRNICSTCLSNDRRLSPLSKISSIINEINLQELNKPGFVCWECYAIIMKFYKFKKRCKQAETALNSHRKKLKPLSTLRHTKALYDLNYNDPLTNSDIDKMEIKTEPEEMDFKNETNITIYEDCIHAYNSGIDKVETNLDRPYKDRNENVSKIVKNVNVEECSDIDNMKHHVTIYADYIHANNSCIDQVENNVDKEATKERNIKSNIDNIKNAEVIPGIDNIDDKTITDISDVEIIEKDTDIGIIEDSDTDTEIKRKINKTVNVKLNKITKDKVLEKFDYIVFTEEEVIKNREEKQNRPNYKKIPFKCDSCVLGFTKKMFYIQHVVKKHDESIGNSVCPVCDVRFPNTLAMERHKTKHYTCYRCKLCKYDTVELWSAMNHCRIKHARDTADSIHCAQCQHVCRSPEELSEHVKLEHIVSCSECGVTFKGVASLKSHKRRVHAVKRNFQCDICKKTFTKKSRLESHVVRHNDIIAKKLAYCAICDVQYKNINIYRSHLRTSTNHNERLFPCSVCNKNFASKFYRKQHYDFYHLQKSKYKCDVCNKIFISAWRLRDHKQTKHETNRPRDHPCNVCGKKFFTASMLRSHKLTHSDQRSYMCEDCGDTFRQAPALYTHMRLVHKGVKRKKS